MSLLLANALNEVLVSEGKHVAFNGLALDVPKRGKRKWVKLLSFQLSNVYVNITVKLELSSRFISGTLSLDIENRAKSAGLLIGNSVKGFFIGKMAGRSKIVIKEVGGDGSGEFDVFVRMEPHDLILSLKLITIDGNDVSNLKQQFHINDFSYEEEPSSGGLVAVPASEGGVFVEITSKVRILSSQLFTDWINLNLFNGWVNKAGFTSRVKRLVDGGVVLQVAVNGAAKSGNNIAVLPFGFSSSTTNVMLGDVTLLSSFLNSASSGDVFINTVIYPNHEVT